MHDLGKTIMHRGVDLALRCLHVAPERLAVPLAYNAAPDLEQLCRLLVYMSYRIHLSL